MVHWLIFSLYEPYLHQKICRIQILLSYLARLCIAWSLSTQVFWVARVIHVSLVKTVQTQKTCLILFYLLHYLCLICFPGMDWWARNNSFFIFLDKLEGARNLSLLQEHTWIWIIVRQQKSGFRTIFQTVASLFKLKSTIALLSLIR